MLVHHGVVRQVVLATISAARSLPTPRWWLSCGDTLEVVPQDDLTTLLGEALRDLVLFVESRPDHATQDDDVRALEGVAWTLDRAAPADKERIREVLGDDVSSMLGCA